MNGFCTLSPHPKSPPFRRHRHGEPEDILEQASSHVLPFFIEKHTFLEFLAVACSPKFLYFNP